MHRQYNSFKLNLDTVKYGKVMPQLRWSLCFEENVIKYIKMILSSTSYLMLRSQCFTLSFKILLKLRADVTSGALELFLEPFQAKNRIKTVCE